MIKTRIVKHSQNECNKVCISRKQHTKGKSKHCYQFQWQRIWDTSELWNTKFNNKEQAMFSRKINNNRQVKKNSENPNCKL